MNPRHLRKAVSPALGIVVAMFLLGTTGCTSLKPGADLRGADLSGRKLAGKDLRDADLSGANLVGANLANAVLRNANLSQADLSGADLGGADLRDATLAGAKLDGARLRDANLTGAALRDATLSAANLSYAKLAGADLRGADLSNSDLAGADLGEATLTGADFSDANLSSANLEGSVGLSQYGLSRALGQQALLGEPVMFELFSEACLGRPIPGATALEPVLDGREYVLLNGSGTRLYRDGALEDHYPPPLVRSIGSVRYVVCIEDVRTVLESCGNYLPIGAVDITRIDVKVKIVDIRNGKVVASELFRGEDPEIDYCPDRVCQSFGLGGTEGCGDATPLVYLTGYGARSDLVLEFVRTSVDAYEAQAPE